MQLRSEKSCYLKKLEMFHGNLEMELNITVIQTFGGALRAILGVEIRGRDGDSMMDHAQERAREQKTSQ